MLGNLSSRVSRHLSQATVVPLSLLLELHHDLLILNAEVFDYPGRILDLLGVSFNRVLHFLVHLNKVFVVLIEICLDGI